MNGGRKRRAPQGDLARLTYAAREQLHAWFREGNGTITYKEVLLRLAEKFDIHISQSTISAYYNDKYAEIVNPEGRAVAAESPQAVVIRIEVTAGCRVKTSVESAPGGTV